jgi:hypothetical protein
MTNDLWPDDLIGHLDVKSPIAILKEQASLLGQKTKNLIEAEVRPYQREETLTPVEQITGLSRPRPIPNEGDFRFDFYLVAKTLGYRYKLLSFQHDINLYPVAVVPDEDIMVEITGGQKVQKQWAKSESELTELLQRIFAAQKTRHVIRALLAQMTS